MSGARVIGQAPLGPEFVVADTSIDASFQQPAALACDGQSVCAVVWTSVRPDGGQNNERIWVATYTAEGRLIRRTTIFDGDQGVPTAVGLASGFTFFLDRVGRDGITTPVFRVFDENLDPQADEVELPLHDSPYQSPAAYYGICGVARSAKGYVLLSTAFTSPIVQDRLGVFLYFVDSQGRLLRNRVAVNQYQSDDARLPQNGGGIAEDSAGNLIVTYCKAAGNRNGPWDVYLRRFSPSGEPLGPELRVNTYRKDAQWFPQLAVSPDGQFLVVWQSKGEDGSDDGIYARLYSKEGWWLTRGFRVNDLTFSAQRFPHVAADRLGNYFIGWSSFPADEVRGYEVKGKVYRHDLTPVGGEYFLNQQRLYDQILTQATFTLDGTLFALWSSASPQQAGGEGAVPVARRFAVTPP